MSTYPSPVDGIWYEDVTAATHTGAPYPGTAPGVKYLALGQTGNTVATNVANQGIGTVACPALSAGAVGTVTISDSLITANSLIFCTVRRGTTTPASGAYCMVRDVMTPTSSSVVVNVVNLGSAATLSTDEQLFYMVVN